MHVNGEVRRGGWKQIDGRVDVFARLAVFRGKEVLAAVATAKYRSVFFTTELRLIQDTDVEACL